MDETQIYQLDMMVHRLSRISQVMAMTACANAVIESMKAANKERERRGQSLAYPEEAFRKVIDDEGIGHNAVHGLLYS